MLAPGSRVGRYEIVGVLGRGGMAVVYEATHVDLGRPVALKKLVLGPADARLAERFLLEARTGGALAHPNIVPVFDYFEHDRLPYIAMELMVGGSLRPLMGTLTLAQTAGVLEGVLAGLAHAERRGIVHRDIKPENLLVTEDGQIKIADFGIAKAVDRTTVGHSLTAAGMMVGTPSYMAPEQARGERVGPAADLYSLGIVAYELLTGDVPFGRADTPIAAILMRHVSTPVPDPLERKPDLDPELAAWTLRLLAKQPAERPARAAEAWDELEPSVLRLFGPRWRREARVAVPGLPDTRDRPVPQQADHAPPQRKTPPPQRKTPPPQRRPRRALPLGLLAAAVVVLAGAAALALTGGGDNPNKPSPQQPMTEKQVMGSIEKILKFSKQGRDLRKHGHFGEAVKNRQQTLGAVQKLEGQTKPLDNQAVVHAVALLDNALFLTLQSAEAYKKCNSQDCPPAKRVGSGPAKKKFCDAFNPLAQQFHQPTCQANKF
jgi:serine/threonine protein kinase